MFLKTLGKLFFFINFEFICKYITERKNFKILYCFCPPIMGHWSSFVSVINSPSRSSIMGVDVWLFWRRLLWIKIFMNFSLQDLYSFSIHSHHLYGYMEASEPKWVNPIMNIIGVNQLRLGGLQIYDDVYSVRK